MTTLPFIGSQGFTPSLLDAIHSHPSMRGWTVDPSLFSVLLLAMIVRRGGVIVNTSFRHVNKTLSTLFAMTKTIFGLSTHHLHLDQYTSPEEIPWRILRQHTPDHTPLPSSRRTSAIYSNINNSSSKSTPIATPRSNFTELNNNNDQMESPKILIVTGMENASSPARIKLGEILTSKKVDEWSFDGLIIWIREEGQEQVPSWMLDHFLCGITSSPDVPPLDLGLGPIVPESYIANLHDLLPYTHIHPPLQIHISNLLSAVSSHPSLKTTITQRATRSFYDVVRAHRLLSGGFDLPSGWERQKTMDNGRKGFSGGRGGVDSWARLAGEEPSVSELAGEEWGGEDWYATPFNVSAVFGVCVRHRVRHRGERAEVMWLMKGAAGDGSSSKRRDGDVLDEILRTV